MDVIIKQTGELESLSIKCQGSGVDYISDFIGNAGGFRNGDFVRFSELSEDEQQKYADMDEHCYYASQSNFDWWQRIVNLTDEADSLIADNDALLTHAIKLELQDACNSEIEDTAERRLNIIKRALGEIALSSSYSKDWQGVSGGHCLEIVDASEDDSFITCTARGGFTSHFKDEQGDSIDEFCASISGTYNTSDDGDNEVAFDDDLDTDCNLSTKQADKVRGVLQTAIGKHLSDKGYFIKA